jgi:ketosteroid isomerase-like protein
VSEENVARVRESVERLAATGEPAWDVLHEDIEVLDHDIPDAGEYRGLSGFGRWLEDWASAWSEFSLEPEEYLDVGDSVVVVFLMRATGVGSGVTVERRDAMVCKMHDLKVARVDYYNNREQALAAVGMD